MDGRLAIVRDFEGKPLARVVVNIGDRLVYVANPDLLERVQAGKSSAVGFPPEDVYVYDDITFSKMSSEWEATGRASQWNALKIFR
jgi:hypothetical protein